MDSRKVLILGCGYTGSRVAALLAQQGHQVLATRRTPIQSSTPSLEFVVADVQRPSSLVSARAFVDAETLVLHSIPSTPVENSDEVIAPVLAEAARVVYISTTGVYGRQHEVDATSVPQPETPRELARVATERSVAATRCPLILRPAAIYGPHRGLHTSIRAGQFRLRGDGSNHVSRIHVDDLVTHCMAGLFSTLKGAWPVADERPCESREIAEFCARLLGVSMPPEASSEELSETRRADRKVDGSAVREALGISLRYPDYRAGIPACIAAEAAEMAEAPERER